MGQVKSKARFIMYISNSVWSINMSNHMCCLSICSWSTHLRFLNYVVQDITFYSQEEFGEKTKTSWGFQNISTTTLVRNTNLWSDW